MCFKDLRQVFVSFLRRKHDFRRRISTFVWRILFEEPRIWTSGFNQRTRVLKSVTATQERLDMRSRCHAAKTLPVGVRGTKNVWCLTTKINFEKLLGVTRFKKPTISIRFNLLQVCPSVLPFVFSVLKIPSFNVLSDYVYVWKKFAGSSYMLEFWQNSWHSSFKLATIGADNSAMDYNDPVKAGAGGGGGGVGWGEQ